LGFTFGIFAATSITVGGFSDFEIKYKWLILPNLALPGDALDSDEPLPVNEMTEWQSCIEYGNQQFIATCG
jgi:hypothetical protein